MTCIDLRFHDGDGVSDQPVDRPAAADERQQLDQVLQRYNATRLPNCTVHGLWDALQRRSVELEPIDLTLFS